MTLSYACGRSPDRHGRVVDLRSQEAGHKRRAKMPLFMDVHRKAPEGAKAKDVADAHMADVKTQGKYGVQYLRYWFDEKNGKIFCLVDAPNAEAANRVHKEAHGLVADEIYPVTEGM